MMSKNNNQRRINKVLTIKDFENKIFQSPPNGKEEEVLFKELMKRLHKMLNSKPDQAIFNAACIAKRFLSRKIKIPLAEFVLAHTDAAAAVNPETTKDSLYAIFCMDVPGSDLQNRTQEKLNSLYTPPQRPAETTPPSSLIEDTHG